MTRSRLLRGTVATLIIGVVAYFFIRALRANGESLAANPVSFGWWTVIALVAFVAAVAVSGVLWGRIVSRLEERPLPVFEAIRVHFASWLLKYVPGQAGFVLNKVVWAQRRGTSRALALMSVVYENAFLLFASIVPMLAALLVVRAVTGGEEDYSTSIWLAVTAVVILVALLHPYVLRTLIGILAKRLTKDVVPPEYFLGAREVVVTIVMFVGPRLINGVGVAVIAWAIAGVGPEAWIPVTAAYAIAGALGIMAVFVPSGLGVRESVFVVLLAGTLPLDRAIVVSLVARVVSTVADIVIAGAYGAMTLVAKRRKQQS